MVSKVNSEDSLIDIYYGLSTDVKPTKVVGNPESVYPRNGSKFYEMDTSKLYKFDYENKEWIEQ